MKAKAVHSQCAWTATDLPAWMAQASGKFQTHRTLSSAQRPQLLTLDAKQDAAAKGASQRAHPTLPLGEAARNYVERPRLRASQAARFTLEVSSAERGPVPGASLGTGVQSPGCMEFCSQADLADSKGQI